MLEVISSKNEIKTSQNKFEEAMVIGNLVEGTVKVGFQGGYESLEISWSNDLGIWWGFGTARNRYWNAFGTEEPEWDSTYTHIITCEINPPYEGIRRYLQGIFAKDENERYYLLHRGKIGGGRVGIGKELFMREYRSSLIDVRDGDRVTTVALVGVLDSPRFPLQVATFVHEVDRIKYPPTEDSAQAPSLSFNEEFSGTKKVKRNENDVVATCDHGVIVNTLAGRLESNGIKIGNTRPIDLFTYDDAKQIQMVFEVKTSTCTTDLYGAIGQLMFHTAEMRHNPRKVVVSPDPVDTKTRRTFESLEIDVLTYSWKNNKPHFRSLSKVLPTT